MKQLVLTIVALVAGSILVGCGTSDSTQPPAEEPPVTVAESALKPDPKPAAAPEADPEKPAKPQRPDKPESEPLGEPESAALPEIPADFEFEQPNESDYESEEKPVDLGPPLVEEPENLKRLDPKRPVWVDMKNKRVVMVGQICQREALLELFVCLRNTKEHEAIVTVDVQAQSVHAGLLAVGAQVGSPVRWNPAYSPATGTEIEITLVWKDEKGQRKTARAQDWVLDTQTEKAMTHTWVFAGSGFWEDERTGQKHYQAEGGDLICVSNFSSAMLDLPIESSQANGELMFQAFTERIPPLGTPTTIVLSPQPPDE